MVPAQYLLRRIEPNELRKSLAVNISQFSNSSLRYWSPLPLRLIVGYGFIEHGYAKLIHNPERFFAILHALGVPAPALMGWLTIVVELLGGLTVLVGALIPLVVRVFRLR